MPGVIILEAMAQTAGILTFITRRVSDENVRFYFADRQGALRSRSCRRQVVLTPRSNAHPHIWKYSIVATVDGAEVASAEMMVMPG